MSTPTIDRFAGEGIRFENAYSPHPVCTPARGAIQTGCLKFDHRAVLNWVPIDHHPDRPTIARTFRDAGYRTGYIGKWHLDGQTGKGSYLGADDGDGSGFVPPGSRRLGYDFWAGFNVGHRHHDGHPSFTRDGTVSRERESEWQPTVQTDIAREFVERNSEEPFFLTLSWGPPHPPFEAPEGYADRHDPEGLDLPPNVPDDLRDELLGDLAQYYGMIEAIDDDFADLLDALDERGLREDTVVVFTADHGEMLGAHGQRIGKNNPYEEAANVPLIVRYPDAIDADRVSEGLVSLVDLYPTLAGLCDLSIPNRVRGHDYAGHLRGEDGPPEDPVYLTGDWRAVRSGSYMLRVDDGLQPSQLYDLAADPYQRENLAADADPELLADLLGDLVEQAYRFGDGEMVGRALRRETSWADDLDDAVERRLDVDHERYRES